MELRDFMFDLFFGDVVLLSPGSGCYPACWVHELSNEGLSVNEILERIGIKNFFFNPSTDCSFFENLKKVCYFGKY